MATNSLSSLIRKNGTVVAPGVFSPSVALLAQQAGFECAYFSGAGFANLTGLPDIGITTLSEVATAVREITAVSKIPLIVDVDTGFGEPVNVARTVSEIERAGAAAIQIEDQVMPKRCGHLSGKEVVAPEEMTKKIIAAKQARKTGLLIIARTDAVAIEGIDSAIERAKLYLKAGADVIFPEALETRKQFVKFSQSVKAPLLANMTEFGKSPYLTVSDFEKMGYRIVIFPVTAFRMAMRSVQDCFRELHDHGTQKKLLNKLMTRDEFNKLINYEDYESVDRRVSRVAGRLGR